MSILAYCRSFMGILCLYVWVVFFGCQQVSAIENVEVRQFDVPAGKAAKTLKRAVQQADVKFMFSAQVVRGVRTRSIQGEYTPIEAFRLMLADTPLAVFQHENSGVYLIKESKFAGPANGKSSSGNTAAMNENKKARSSLLKRLLAVAVSNAPGPSTQDKEEGVYELSPFTVDASQGTGYRASNTLAGTRLNTQLKDVAVSVSVVTEDFMDDIGSSDLESLLTYTGGTETGGINGNILGADIDDDGRVNVHRSDARPQSALRIRSLGNADLTQDYFLSEAPFDSFNIDQITINRGPNSALFGLGSPGGILNASLKKAQFRNFTEVETKHDHFGTARYVLDVNRQLVENKLAFRFVGLSEDIQYEQKSAFEEDHRVYAAVSFKPFEKTTIRANFTRGEGDASRPVSRPPQDRIKGWASIGKPLFDPITNRFFSGVSDFNSYMADPDNIDSYAIEESVSDAWDDVTSNSFSEAKNGRNFVATYGDPNSSALGGDGYASIMRYGIYKDKVFGNYEGDTIQAIAWEHTRAFWRLPEGSVTGGLARGLSASEVPFYTADHVTDRNIFDYRTDSIEGPNRKHVRDFESYSATLEQTFLEDKLGFEISTYDENYQDDYFDFRGGLLVDTNLRYAHGDLNPNVGRAYTGGNSYSEPFFLDKKASRVTAFAKYDFADRDGSGWVSKLGSHALTALYGTQEADKRVETHKGTFVEPATVGYSTGKEEVQRFRGPVVYRLSYLGGGSLLDGSGYGGITGLSAVQKAPTSVDDILTWDAERGGAALDDGRSYTDGFRTVSGDIIITERNPELTFHGGNNRNFSEVESFSTVLQSRFLNGNLVTTGSWRRDSVDLGKGSWSRSGPENLTRSGVPPLDPAEAIAIHGIEANSFSVVGHMPTFFNDKLPGDSELSIHYVDSSNVNAQGGNIDLFGRSLSLSEGATEEIGFSLRSLGGKLFLRATWFDSQVADLIEERAIGSWANIETRILENNTSDELFAAGFTPADPRIVEAFGIGPDGTTTETTLNGETVTLRNYNVQNSSHIQQASTYDTTAEGMELELTYNPTDNWRISLNATKSEAVRSNIARLEVDYVANRRAVWEANGDLWYETTREQTVDGVTTLREDNRIMVPDPSNPSGPKVLHGDILQELATLAAATSREGLPVAELRKWRVNLITNYSFKDSEILKGFNVGGAVRYQGKMEAGHGIALDEEAAGWVPDPSQAFYAPSETQIDLWLGFKHRFEKSGVVWRARLGAKNINSNEGLIPAKFNPDGRVGAWRIEPGKLYELSNSFSF